MQQILTARSAALDVATFARTMGDLALSGALREERGGAMKSGAFNRQLSAAYRAISRDILANPLLTIFKLGAVAEVALEQYPKGSAERWAWVNVEQTCTRLETELLRSAIAEVA